MYYEEILYWEGTEKRMSSWALFSFFIVANQSEMCAAEEHGTEIILKGVHGDSLLLVKT